jgi:O-antigen/teichoic acid export membrane protein
MGPLQRILKNLAALVTGRMVSILQQIVVPPIFIHFYRLDGYGEWMVLSGAVAALGMLNFGVQTFMNQDLAIRFNRGETEGYHIRQSTALRLLGSVVAAAAVLLLGFFFIPFDTMLKLDISRHAAQLTLYLLALQVLFTILFGYFGGIFMGVNLNHRSTHWNNAQALCSAVGLLIGVLLHKPFPVLAGIQLSSLLLCIVGVLIDLRRTAPEVFPSLKYWDGTSIREILSGSGYFGMLEMSTFFVYQAPLLIMQRMIGPGAVAAFTLMRTIFSMCRQILSTFTQAMSAEITVLYGRRDWPSLTRLYNYSERFIFFLIALVNLSVLMLSPVLITVWIHKKSSGSMVHDAIGSFTALLLHAKVSELFAVYPYVLSSALSIIISLKEHKSQFQFSTNTHVEMARSVFFSYVTMVFVSVGTIHYAGVNGFLWTWLIVELMLTARLVTLNNKLFKHVEEIDTVYITRLSLLCVAGLLLAFAALPHSSGLPLSMQALLATAVAAAVGMLAWQIFRMKEVFASMKGRLSNRFA